MILTSAWVLSPPVCLRPYCPLWCAEISDFRVCASAVLKGKRKHSPGCLCASHLSEKLWKCGLCLSSCQCTCIMHVFASFQIIFTVLCVNGLCLCREIFLHVLNRVLHRSRGVLVSAVVIRWSRLRQVLWRIITALLWRRYLLVWISFGLSNQSQSICSKAAPQIHD